jgi:hypothetical protein
MELWWLKFSVMPKQYIGGDLHQHQR